MKTICENIIKNNIGDFILREKFLFYLFNKQELNHLFLNLIMDRSYMIEYINNPTEEMKLIAVKKAGSVIKYIKNPTDKIKFYR